MMEKTTKEQTAVESDLSRPAEKGAGFLLWGLVVVTLLNLSMVIAAVVTFAP